MKLSFALFVLLLSVINGCLAESMADIQQDETKADNFLENLSSAIPSEFSYELINTAALNESLEISTNQSNYLCASLSNVLKMRCGCKSAANVEVVFQKVIQVVCINSF